MKRKSDQRVKVFFYILLTFVFILTSVGISFASERSIRSISVPHRDVDITLNPGGNQQFSRNEILDFQADAVELEVTGNNQFITVELDSMVNNENDTLQVHTWYKLFLDNNAPAGEEYDVFVVFTYTAGDNRSVQQEAYTVTVASLEADFNTDVVRGHIPLDVEFEDVSTGAGIVNWFWEFGDGRTSQQQNPSHTYQRHGYYDVSLMVTNRNGDQDTKIRYEYIAAVDPDLDELSYEDPDDLPNFLTLPESNGFEDMYYNVRFTPPYPRYQIMEARIALFDLFGFNGTPGMKVIVWGSGEQDGEPGYPGEALDSVFVPYGDLHFGSTEPVYNTVDLRQLEIINYGGQDFHIGVEIVSDEENEDTLAVYVDDGRYVDVSRSLFWSNDDEIWMKIDDEDAYEDPFNFAIHAVLQFAEDVPNGIDPANLPNTLLLNPAFPNPFNSSTTVHFQVPFGIPFTSALFDQSGRWIHNIDAGIGSGNGSWVINKGEFPTGTYVLRLSTPLDSKSMQLIYLR
ncbi:MAG: PKD domain-containing protein [Calditrichaeota bacterium]|nr:PKD domain-containing protein [Calditrichota bacterium]